MPEYMGGDQEDQETIVRSSLYDPLDTYSEIFLTLVFRDPRMHPGGRSRAGTTLKRTFLKYLCLKSQKDETMLSSSTVDIFFKLIM